MRGWAVTNVITAAVHTVLGPHVVLKCHCVDKSFFTTDLTLVYHISAGASPLVELMVVPFLQSLVAGWALNLLVCILRKDIRH